MSKRETSNSLGRHLPNNGEGLTAEDLYRMLRSLTPAERRKSYVGVGGHDVIGMSVGQSDQAPRGEVKVWLLLDKSAEDKLW